MLSRHLWLQRPVALQTMSEGLEKKKKKKKVITVSKIGGVCVGVGNGATHT